MDNVKPWYEDRQSFDIPKFIGVMKELIFERFQIVSERDSLVGRLKTGANFIGGLAPSNLEVLKEAIAQYLSYCNEISAKEDRITQIDISLTMILEAKLADLGFVINTNKGDNELGIEIDNRKIYCLPWKNLVADDLITVTPEDIWFFAQAKSLFKANPNNIEFITKDKLNSIFGEENK